MDNLDEYHAQTGSRTEGLLSCIKNLLGWGQNDVHSIDTSLLKQDIPSTLSELVGEEHRISTQSNLVTLPVMTSMHAFALGLKREIV